MRTVISKVISRFVSKKSRLDEKVLQEICKCYNLKNVKLLRDNGNNFVYETNDRILKITGNSHIGFETIKAQTDWQNYLFEAGLPVVKTFKSGNGLIVEKVDYAGSYFSAVLYAKASGGPFKDAQWNTNEYKLTGAIVGQLHKATKNYKSPSMGNVPVWHSEEKKLIKARLSTDDPLLCEMMEYLNRMDQMPKNETNYGIVHNDFHRGNTFVNPSGQISVFDFDDTTYSFFANDIACCFYQSFKLLQDDPLKGLKDAPLFVDCFFNGYAAHNSLDAAAINDIGWMSKSRAISVVGYLQMLWKNQTLTPGQQNYLEQARWYATGDYLLTITNNR